MTTTLELKLRGIFLSDDSPENLILTTPISDLFSNILSAVTTFIQYLTSLFNQQFPPESRDEYIHRLSQGATPYLIGAVVLITCLCCWSCISSCVSGIFSGLYNVVRSFFRCVCCCFCCGRRSRGRMMKAPGRYPMRIPRDAFEGNPREYFRDFRGQPNNFVY